MGGTHVHCAEAGPAVTRVDRIVLDACERGALYTAADVAQAAFVPESHAAAAILRLLAQGRLTFAQDPGGGVVRQPLRVVKPRRRSACSTPPPPADQPLPVGAGAGSKPPKEDL